LNHCCSLIERTQDCCLDTCRRDSGKKCCASSHIEAIYFVRILKEERPISDVELDIHRAAGEIIPNHSGACARAEQAEGVARAGVVGDQGISSKGRKNVDTVERANANVLDDCVVIALRDGGRANLNRGISLTVNDIALQPPAYEGFRRHDTNPQRVLDTVSYHQRSWPSPSGHIVAAHR